LMRTGAYSLTAQTTIPSSTLPGHTSMLSGLCPSAHGVDWDHYLPEKGYARGTDLFDLAHAAGLRTVMVVAKEKLRQVVEPDSLDVFLWVNDPDGVVARRAAGLIPDGFSVLFVHLADTDHAGHSYGWMSLPQILSLRRTDSAIKIILQALEAAAMRETALIIVTADHGGHDGGHSGGTPPDLTIPWVINGPGVLPGPLESSVNTVDTAATAAWALGLPLPPEWSGRPVLEAFGLPDDAPRPAPRCR
ncbi:MAG: alkaline phosphatase family protein, partial [Bacteroidota bacterium]